MQVLATVALLTSLLGADPPSGDSTLAEAKAHVDVAKKAFVARKFNVALQEFQAAQRLKPAPFLWFNIGKCYEKINEFPSALRAFRAYLHEAPSPSDKKEVKAAITRMEAKLRSKGVQQLIVFSNPPGATASISGKGALPVPATWELRPGTYTVTVSLPGYQTTQKPVTVTMKGSAQVEVALEPGGGPLGLPPPMTPVTPSKPPDEPPAPLVDSQPPPVKDGNQGTVTVAVRPNTPTAPNTPSTPPPRTGADTPVLQPSRPPGDLEAIFNQPRQPLATTPAPTPSGGRTWTWVAGGVSVAGAGAGVFFGLSANSARDALVGPGLRTEADNNQLYSRAKSSALYANIGYGAAAAAGVTAIVLFLVEGAPSSAQASAAPASGGAPVAITF